MPRSVRLSIAFCLWVGSSRLLRIPRLIRRLSRSARMLDEIPGRIARLAEVTFAAEHQVAKDEERPRVAEDLEAEIDGAVRARRHRLRACSLVETILKDNWL